MFYLADQRGIGIDEVLTMPNLEFTAWMVFYGRRSQFTNQRPV